MDKHIKSIISSIRLYQANKIQRRQNPPIITVILKKSKAKFTKLEFFEVHDGCVMFGNSVEYRIDSLSLTVMKPLVVDQRPREGGFRWCDEHQYGATRCFKSELSSFVA